MPEQDDLPPRLTWREWLRVFTYFLVLTTPGWILYGGTAWYLHHLYCLFHK